MASGFLVLPDGRCFSRRATFHDAILKAIAEQTTDPQLHRWITEQFPGLDDTEDFGWGWLRTSDRLTVQRFIDLRMMTEKFAGLFLAAAMQAKNVHHQDEQIQSSLSDLADMIERMNRGEPPLSKSDWRQVVPAQGEKIGPR